MIFATVGTTQYPFQRMSDFVALLERNLQMRETIVFQFGATQVNNLRGIKNIRLFDYLSYSQTIEFIKKARCVLCHAGPATIYQCFELGKVPYVLARSQKYHEHVDDHQVCFADYLQRKGRIHQLTPSVVQEIMSNDATKSITPPVVYKNPEVLESFLQRVTKSLTTSITYNKV